MSASILRPVAATDAPALAELLNAVIARGGTTSLEEAFTPERLASTYLTGPDVICCFVAIDRSNTGLLGFQTLGFDAKLPDGWGDIGTFARVDGVRKGMGTALFAATRSRAASLGLIAINATIRADNGGGLAFYSHMGFEDYAVDSAVALRDGTRVDRIRKRYML